MDRGLSAGAQARVDSGKFDQCHLVKIAFPSGTVYLTDYGHDIDYAGNTYSKTSALLGVGDMQESTDMRVVTRMLRFSTVVQTYASIALRENIIGRRVDIWRAFPNPATGQLDSDDDVIAHHINGQISNHGIDDSGGSSELEIEVSSHWADFHRKNGIRTNLSSHQRHYPRDTGMRHFATLPQSVTLKWGRY